MSLLRGKVLMKDKIKQLKTEKNAVVLAHYYAPAEIQEAADYVGDSFYLAKIAKACQEDVIVFCGVEFMGESAKILNPNKKVLVLDPGADCPMAHMLKPGRIQQMREKYEDLAVVCYINSTAQLKCQSDVCVTSSNAVKIVKSLPNQNIFFIPDQNLGRYVAQQVPEKNVILNDGYCPIHAAITQEQVAAEKRLHPGVKVLSHPECEEPVLAISDYIGSTAEIIRYVSESSDSAFIICTECGVEYELKKANPGKQFYFPSPCPWCHGMKKNTMERLVHVLETGDNEVFVSNELSAEARKPLDKMLELAK